jgi:membrane-associated protease RseP (regulator of RpoE activity)
VGSTPIHSRLDFILDWYLFMVPADIDAYTPIVARVLQIQDITQSELKSNYLVRYRGVLMQDAGQAYDRLAADLKPLDITPLFRSEKGLAVVLLMPGTINPTPSNPWINVLMFALTALSVLYIGALTAAPVTGNESMLEYFLLPFSDLKAGIPYAASLLAILLAHEFGHYLAARYHKTKVTLPYFIPIPFPPLGTMGAFIRMKEPPKNKRILLDIGVAGPLAGLVVAIPVLLYGLSISTITRLNVPPGSGLQLVGNSILYLLSKYAIFGQLLPTPTSYDGLPLLLYWVRYFFTGQPMPLGGLDVMISPVAWAGWVGLLVTALNLIPAGQLDGGHLLYTLIGKRARILWPFILGALFLLGFAWPGWWLWFVIVLVLGRLYAEPLDQITRLNGGRKAVAIAGLVIFLLVFTPVPIIQYLT